MFPNVRLMIMATFASVVVLSCGFGLFAAFRVNHEPLSRLPPVTAPLQLAADDAAPTADTIAPGGPIGPDVQVNEAQIGANAAAPAFSSRGIRVQTQPEPAADTASQPALQPQTPVTAASADPPQQPQAPEGEPGPMKDELSAAAGTSSAATASIPAAIEPPAQAKPAEPADVETNTGSIPGINTQAKAQTLRTTRIKTRTAANTRRRFTRRVRFAFRPYRVRRSRAQSFARAVAPAIRPAVAPAFGPAVAPVTSPAVASVNTQNSLFPQPRYQSTLGLLEHRPVKMRRAARYTVRKPVRRVARRIVRRSAIGGPFVPLSSSTPR